MYFYSFEGQVFGHGQLVILSIYMQEQEYIINTACFDKKTLFVPLSNGNQF